MRLALAVLPALLAVDTLSGLFYRTDTSASLVIKYPRSGKSHRAIVVFPGFLMPGGPLARAFEPYIADDDAMVVINYAERGVNVPQIYDRVMGALAALKPVELRVYGASMGGMVGKLFLDHYRQGSAPYGKVTLILDSAPAGRHNLKRPSFLFDLSCWYRGGLLSTAVLALVSEFGDKPPPEDGVPPEIVRAARYAGAWAGMPAATSQACFIARFASLKPGELLDITQEVVYLQGHSPERDPVLRVSEAIAEWRVAFPGLIVITLQHRSGRWHLPLVEYPRETVRAITATPS